MYSEVKLGKLVDILDYKNSLINHSDFVSEIEDGTFSIAPISDRDTVKKLVCKHCGTDKFFVGTSYCFTAIRCPNCGYEVPIHEG